MKDKETLVGEKTHDFESLVSLTEILRSPDGCPWDREQTHKSVRPCLIEEAYEVCEAIDTDDADLMREELGDLMFQVMFHAEIEKEKGNFDICGVIDGICAKMIARHPHVFGGTLVSGSAEVLDNWDTIKKKEKSLKSPDEELTRIPKQLPALMRAQKVQKKAKKYGCGFESAEKAALHASKCISAAAESFGDPSRRAEPAADAAFSAEPAADRRTAASCDENFAEAITESVFALCAAASLSGIDIEEELAKRTDKFISDFAKNEKQM